jgi:hypothetical protein
MQEGLMARLSTPQFSSSHEVIRHAVTDTAERNSDPDAGREATLNERYQLARMTRYENVHYSF